MPVNETIERIVFEGVDKLSAASKSAQASTKALKDTIDSVKTVLGALGVTVGVGAFVKLQLDALQATAALNDMSEATGASVENLSAIQRVARVGGHDFEGLTLQLGRMVRGLKDNTDEGNKSIAALAQLGIKSRDANGQWRDTGDILIEVARRMGAFRTDADRVAFVQDALGKGAERYIPLLKQMAEGTDLHAKVTKEQAERAEEAERNLNRLKLSMEDARRELTNQFTPALVDFTNKLIAAKDATGGLASGIAAMYQNAGQTEDVDARLAEIETRMRGIDAEARTLMSVQGPAGVTTAFLLKNLEVQTGKLILERQYLMKLKQTGLAPDNSAGGAMDMGVGVKDVFSGQQDYQSLDPRRLKPSEILKMQQQGQEDFNQFVIRSNVEMNKVLDEQQKKNLIDHTANLMAAYDREQELAVENAQLTGAADGESHSLQLVRLNEYLVGAASIEKDAFQQRLQTLAEFSDAELEQYGGRLAIIEGLYGEHSARLLDIDRNRNSQARGMEMQTWQLAANFVQLFATKSKAAAIVAIALNKGLAIAQVIVNTQAAIMRGYAELGPYAGTAMAAYLTGLEAISIGIIAATGVVEASQVGSSGGGGGGGPSLGGPSAQPVFSADSVSGAPAAPPRQSVTIIIPEGQSSYTTDQLRAILEGLAKLTEDGAHVFVERRR